MSLSRCNQLMQLLASSNDCPLLHFVMQMRGCAATLRNNRALFSLMRRGFACLYGLPSCVLILPSVEAFPANPWEAVF